MHQRAAIARASWIAALEQGRRSWPAWAMLEQQVRERDFEVHTIGPRVFLYAHPTPTAPPLSRQVASGDPPVPEVGAPFPAWVSSLIGVDNIPAGELSSAGALAADLWPPTPLRPVTELEEWEHGCELDPANDQRSSRIYILQRNRSGTPLFSDGVDVLTWAWPSRTFQKVAPLDVFLQFCLRHVMVGEPWWESWARGDGTREGIRPKPPC